VASLWDSFILIQSPRRSNGALNSENCRVKALILGRVGAAKCPRVEGDQGDQLQSSSSKAETGRKEGLTCILAVWEIERIGREIVEDMKTLWWCFDDVAGRFGRGRNGVAQRESLETGGD
jgi:hypothetical protein